MYIYIYTIRVVSCIYRVEVWTHTQEAVQGGFPPPPPPSLSAQAKCIGHR